MHEKQAMLSGFTPKNRPKDWHMPCCHHLPEAWRHAKPSPSEEIPPMRTRYRIERRTLLTGGTALVLSAVAGARVPLAQTLDKLSFQTN